MEAVKSIESGEQNQETGEGKGTFIERNITCRQAPLVLKDYQFNLDIICTLEIAIGFFI